MGLLRETAWDSSIFFHLLNTCWFLQPEVMRLILLALQPWVVGPRVVLGVLAPKIPLLDFYPPHVDVRLAHPFAFPSFQS